MLDLNFINEEVAHTKFSSGDVTIFNYCSLSTPWRIPWYLSVYDGLLSNKIGQPVGQISANLELRSNYARIIDCYVNRTGERNGRIMFAEFFRILNLINVDYPINSIRGMLSSVDRARRLQQINFYDHLDQFVNPYLEDPIQTKFTLRGYDLTKFIDTISDHEEEHIYFDIFVDFHPSSKLL